MPRTGDFSPSLDPEEAGTGELLSSKKAKLPYGRQAAAATKSPPKHQKAPSIILGHLILGKIRSHSKQDNDFREDPCFQAVVCTQMVQPHSPPSAHCWEAAQFACLSQIWHWSPTSSRTVPFPRAPFQFTTSLPQIHSPGRGCCE